MYRNYLYSLLMIAVTALTLSGCNHQQQHNNNDQQPNASLEISYAQGFNIDYFDHYKRIIVHNPWVKNQPQQIYYLVDNDTITTPNNGVKIVTPIHSIAISSCTHVGELDALQLVNTITGACSPELVYNAEFRHMNDNGKIVNLADAYNTNLEQLLALRADGYMLSSYSQQDENTKRLQQAGVTILYNNEWTEQNILGRAEWIKFVAAFYNKEQMADSIFNDIATQYNTTVEMMSEITEHRPTIMAGNNYKGTWYMPGGESYMGRMFVQAGGDYHYANDTNPQSIPLNFETVLNNFQNCDVWLNAPTNTIDELKQMDERHTLFKAYKNGQVYAFRNRMLNDNNANDFWESGVMKPHILLLDIVWALHPEMVPYHEPYYILKLK